MILATRIALAVWLVGAVATAQDDRREHFESKVRPVLVEHCYPCHNSHEKAEGGLAVDHREGLRRASDHGIAVVPSKPEESLLLDVVRHDIPGLEMPDGAPQLSREVIADLESWIARGAFDPREAPPTAEELAAETGWPALLEKRKQWWSFLPIRDPEPPAATAWSNHPVDRFIAARLQEHGLEPAPAADRRTLARRLSFVLTGLPLSEEETDRYLADESPQATEHLIDRLLASPHHGERFARHWMDVIRYAESHGSEGDPAIPYAYRYRDYLIRAFEEDVPYDQLVREHVAGDLLPDPRIDAELGIDESKLGTAHWRMVFHGFAPTDALEEKVRFTDDQINVFSKAFLGLTVSCARCHDHKFDAISQKDHAALFGILGSTRPAILDVATPERQQRHQSELRALKEEIRQSLAAAWLESSRTLSERWSHELPSAAFDEPSHALSLLAEARRGPADEAFAAAWSRIESAWQKEQQEIERDRKVADVRRWDLGRADDAAEWFPLGNGLEAERPIAGELAIEADGDRILTGIYPASLASHLLSTRHRGVLASPRIALEDELEVWMLIAGAGQSTARYVVQDYPRIGTVYPMDQIRQPRWYWHRYDLAYWKGDTIHLELATAQDAPVEVRNSDRSWFAAREVVLRPAQGQAPPLRAREHWAPLLARTAESPLSSLAQLERLVTEALIDAIEAWRTGRASDAEAMWLDAAQRDGVLPATLSELPSLAPLIDRYRALEAQVPLPIRAPGLAEGRGTDSPLFERGNHRRPGERVPRRFLEAIDPAPYDTPLSGRLELAADLLREDNPLTARVIANRVWALLFGKGLVATPDNFGRLGALPSHPELLDHLATWLRQHDWSIRALIRYLLSSKTWQQSSLASERALALDPGNAWLSHALVRRLDAEAIRDAILAVSGELDPRRFGPPDPANSQSRRRSLYLAVKRNSLDELLQTFDAPVPFSAVGRRAITNVPAQSLTLLNDPFIRELASRLGRRVAKDPRYADDRSRLSALFLSALGRPPAAGELEALASYLEETRASLREEAERRRALDAALLEATEAMDRILAPVRERLEEKAGGERTSGPMPIAVWTFDENLRDGIGSLHGQAFGTAKIAEGCLLLDGNGHVATAPLDRPLKAKTLEVWVQLTDLDQRGGGAMTVQDLAGNVFDSIVFGERDARHWLAGSDFFNRTQFLQGTAEAEATDGPIQVAIAWSEDGTVRAYRNGEPYGQPYPSSGPVTFAEGQVLFGLRHGAAGGNRMLRGRLFEARLYDRALEPDEVRASARGAAIVTEASVRAALDPAAAAALLELEERRASLSQARSELGEAPPSSEALGRVAHLMFNLKEFLYLR